MTDPAKPSSVLVGVLYDFPQADGGALFEQSLLVGIDEVASQGRLDRGVELLARQARGLPSGTAHDVEETLSEMFGAGVVAVVGPTVSDNGLVARELVDAARVPCINYTGGEPTRSRYMFHYQVGSLEEEPVVIAEHLARSELTSVAVVYDHSPVGRGYAEAFHEACPVTGVDVTASASVPPMSEDLTPLIARLRSTGPDSVVYLGLGVAARALAVALKSEKWGVPVAANSALMFGYARKDWRADWDGWVYVDTVADDNKTRARLAQRSRRLAAGPIGVAAYDIGRLLAEAVSRASHLTRDGIRESLEHVKRLPAASGLEGTTMGFGNWDHGALKGRYLVLRRWLDGRSVQLEDQ